MKVINIIGAPGVGKSTFAAGLFAAMKIAGYSVEYVDEYAKAKVYENNRKALRCQPYIFATQLFKLESVGEDRDYIVNDSPIILAAVYNQFYPDSFNRSVIDIHNMFDSINFMLKIDPNREFEKAGRIHGFEEALEIEKKTIRLLEEEEIPYGVVDQYSVTFQELFQYL